MAVYKGNKKIADKLPNISSSTSGKFLTNNGTDTSWGSYTAGTNVSITNNTISATDTTYTAGNGLTLTGTTLSANVENNVTSTSTTNSLSANMGKELQQQINHLESIGRFLSFWNCATGLPTTNPTTSPYTYKTGDYYRVSTVSSGTNYKPNGSSYTTGVASTTVESNPVQESQIYYYDGSSWNLAGGGTTGTDDTTIHYNSDNNLEVIGVKDQKTSSADKLWTGTAAEYNALATKDSNTFYYVENIGIYKGTTLIAGVNTPLLSFVWADHTLNNPSWLQADNFTWNSGTVYSLVYNHLTSDISGKTLQSETIGSTTVQYYLADDGHKICPASEESNVSAIYTATGVAWYYILDTTNTRFKLPRTKWGFEGLRDTVGNAIDESLPNITGSLDGAAIRSIRLSVDGVFSGNTIDTQSYAGFSSCSGQSIDSFTFDASLSSSTYQNNAPVQERATQMYLYFYVGQFTQSALINTAGITSETLALKVDKGHQVIDFQEPTSSNNYTWYRKYADGWVEQGGCRNDNEGTNVTITLPITMSDTNYTAIRTLNGNYSGSGWGTNCWSILTKTTTNFTYWAPANGLYSSWQVSGMYQQ